jgi:hypothetical protein
MYTDNSSNGLNSILILAVIFPYYVSVIPLNNANLSDEIEQRT